MAKNRRAKMKLIFLDLDGVVNSDVYNSSELYKQATAGKSDALIMLIEHNSHLDPDAIKLVNELVDRSGAKVVLSSSWRFKYSPEEATEILKSRGATFTIIANTPKYTSEESNFKSRGEEIASYLSSLKYQPESFVILDDRSDVGNLKNNLVLTDAKYGITVLDVEKGLKILGTKALPK